MSRIEGFEARTDEAVLLDLRARLLRTRWPDSIEEGWGAGADLGFMRRLVDHWIHCFDWRAQEARLNAFRQVRVEVDGLGIHAIHERGRGPRPFPLVVTHGWPGSVFEMLRLIPLLADPGAHGGDPADAFDVVVPSLPGYAYSDRPTRPGCSNARVADLWVGLMEALGYPRFGSQGGDWGAGVSTWLARRHPDRIAGIHLNYIPGSYRPAVAADAYTAEERAFLARFQEWGNEEGGYGYLQRTRPQTLAFGLTDSPAGLAAWIGEKIRAWSDCGGDVESRFSLDEILANVTLYWVTGTIHSSTRLYRESAATPLALAEGERIPVPCGVARFPREEPMPPRSWVERGYNVVRWTEMPRGGHFAAWEEPELLAEDIRAFFRTLR